MHYPMTDEWRQAAALSLLDARREECEAAELARYWLAFRDAAMTMGVIVQRDHRPGYTATLAPGVAEWPGDDWHWRAETAAFATMAAARRAREIEESGEGSETMTQANNRQGQGGGELVPFIEGGAAPRLDRVARWGGTESNRARAARGGFALFTGKPPPSMLPDDPAMPNPAAKDPEPYRAWMRTQSPERQAEFAVIERDAAALRERDAKDPRYGCGATPQPDPAPGQVWLPPPATVPSKWLAADGTLTIEAIGSMGIVVFASGFHGMPGPMADPARGWTCIGVATPHGRVMVGDGFRASSGIQAEVTGVGPGDLLVRGSQEPTRERFTLGHAEAATLLGWTRTRYAPARAGERYASRLTPGRIAKIDRSIKDPSRPVACVEDPGRHSGPVFYLDKMGGRMPAEQWERLDPGTRSEPLKSAAVYPTSQGRASHNMAALADLQTRREEDERQRHRAARTDPSGAPLPSLAREGWTAEVRTEAQPTRSYCMIVHAPDGRRFTGPLKWGSAQATTGPQTVAELDAFFDACRSGNVPQLLPGMTIGRPLAADRTIATYGNLVGSGLPAINLDGWTAEVRDGRESPWHTPQFAMVVVAPDGRRWTVAGVERFLGRAWRPEDGAGILLARGGSEPLPVKGETVMVETVTAPAQPDGPRTFDRVAVYVDGRRLRENEAMDLTWKADDTAVHTIVTWTGEGR